MAHSQISSTKLASGGRIVIPAAYRRALGIKTGDEVVVQLERGSLRVFSRAEALRRLQDKVGRAVPKTVSLSGELIKERREEARRE